VNAGAAVTAAAAPEVRSESGNHRGWFIMISASHGGGCSAGWTALKPSDGAYATTSKVPSVPAGSAVEFAVDYAAGTCRVAFYTAAAVAGGFVEAPYAKMELRFVAIAATIDGRIPAQPVPTLADSGVELYPAASTDCEGAIWRFV
jgi:hypothetical protein